MIFCDVGMSCASDPIVWMELNFMNTQLDRNSQSSLERNPSSVRALVASDKHAIHVLLLFTLSGLLYVTAAVFTTMLTYHAMRDVFLALTIVLFAGMVTGVTLFFVSYKPQPRGANTR
jgi:hypothetical protein